MNLTQENYVLFAAKHYFPVHYTTSEFMSDLQRVVYIKRLLNRYVKTKNASERLILNHLIMLFNVFEPTSSVVSMLFLKLDKDCYSSLKTFLVYLNRLPEEIIINSNNVVLIDIPIDMDIAKILREL